MNDPWFYSKTFFDLLQWFSVAWFNLTLFRINPKKYWLHSIFFALLCHFVPDALTDLLKAPNFRVFFQVSIEILCFWRIFMIPIFFSAMIAVMGSVFLILLQFPLIGVVAYLNHSSMQESMDNVVTYLYTIFANISLTFSLANYLSYKRLGFSFMSISRKRYQVRSERKSLLFLLLSILFALMFLPNTLDQFDITIGILLLITIVTWFLFRQSLLQESSD
jgi:uncharacterized membrane protein